MAVFTLRTFVDYLKTGAEWNRPEITIAIGKALGDIIPDSDMDKEIKVDFKNGTAGKGKDFHYTHDWIVEKHNLESRSIPLITDPVCGEVPTNITETEDGFIIHAELYMNHILS